MKRREMIQWVGVMIGLVVVFGVINYEKVVGILRAGLPAQEAGIMEGILLGSKAGMSKGFYSDLKTSGLVHLVVASGTNMMLLSMVLIEQMATLLGRKKAIGGGIIAMWGYAALVGWQAPIIRACIFLMIRYGAQLAGRKFEWKRGLGVTAILMVAADYTVVTSVSFWLSMVAFGAVSVGVPKIKQLRKVKAWVWIKETMWVNLWLTPILALVFGEISWVSPVSNLLVLGGVEIVSLWGGAAVIVGLIMPIMGKYMLWILIPALRYFEVIVEAASQAGMIKMRFNWMMLVGWYLVLIYFLINMKNTRRNVS